MEELARNDYDEYVNGEWKKSTSIPDDQVRWGSFNILREENLSRLKEICESDESMVGQLYRLALVVPSEVSPAVNSLFDQIDAVVNHSDYLRLSGKLFSSAVGTLFHICKSSDDKDPDNQPPHIYQGSLGLPDMSYYTDRTDIHEAYKTYIREICQLYGKSVNADNILNYEKELAKLHLTRTECRDSERTYNKRDWATVYPLLPEYFDALNLPPLTYVIVQNPSHLEKISSVIGSTPIESLKDYLLFRVASKFAAYQTAAIIGRNFEFYGKLLNGQKVLDEQWKRALGTVSLFLDDELGKLYVAKHFDQSKSAICMDMVNKLTESLRDALAESEWMTADTKITAQQKVDTFRVKIGYPTKYHSVSGLWSDGLPYDLSRAYLEWGQWDWTTQECALFYTPVDRELWHMSPQTVNAYYHPNEIVFPAGILQMPFFGYNTVEENLGAIGSVIGHEMTHGYDDEGRNYNPKGELKEWWSQQDCEEFNLRAKVVEEQFSGLTFMGKQVNGKLTLGENIADIGGLKLAIRALKKHYGNTVTPDAYKRFFEAYAKIERGLIREAYAHKLLAIDPHSPSSLRVNAVLPHIPEFYQTYKVTEVDGMYLSPERRMTIW